MAWTRHLAEATPMQRSVRFTSTEANESQIRWAQSPLNLRWE